MAGGDDGRCSVTARHVHPCPECYRYVPCDMPACSIRSDAERDDVGGYDTCDDCRAPRPAPLTVEECVWWLAVVQAVARPAGRSLSGCAVTQCVRRERQALVDLAGDALTYARQFSRGPLGAESPFAIECLTVWALCRAAARAVALESKGRTC